MLGNHTAGIAILPSPFAGMDGRTAPNPDFNEVRENTVTQNGTDPDRSNPLGTGADIVYLPTGVGTCFLGNTIGTDLPTGVTMQHVCPSG